MPSSAKVFSDTRVFGMNGACADSPCRVIIGGSSGMFFVASDSTYIFWPNTAPAGTTTVYLYMIDGRLRFGVNASSVPDGVTVLQREDSRENPRFRVPQKDLSIMARHRQVARAR